jgi:hypothetical protein
MELRETVELLAKVFKTYQVYPPGHDLRQSFLFRLYRALSSFLKREGLELQIEELKVLSASNEEVFQGEKKDPFPWLLYKNGLRGVAILPGLTVNELDAFLLLVVDKPSDLLYYLLDADLPHIIFEVAEYLLLTDEEEVPEAREWKPPDELYTFNGSDSFSVEEGLGDSDLTQEDTEYLEKALKEESERDHLSIYLDTILSIFTMEEYRGLAKGLMKSVEYFAMESLGLGNPWTVLKLVERFDELREEGKLDQERAYILEGFMASLGSPAALDLLKKHYSPSWGDALKELLFRLDPPHTDKLLEWLEEERREEVKEALLTLLKRKIEALPPLLISLFMEAGPRAKREIVDLAFDFRDREESRRLLESALDSEDEKVRRAAMKAMLKIDPSSLDTLVDRFFRSGEENLRILILDTINELGGVSSLAPILYQEFSEGDFAEKGYLEKRLFFTALALSHEETFKRVLEELLAVTPGWRMRKKWEETVKIALTVAVDTDRIGMGLVRGMVEASKNRRAKKVWDALVETREGIR